MILQSAVSKWAAEQPKTIACLAMLHRNGVRVAVFSSRLAHLAAESVDGIDPDFQPKDTDLILPKEDFDLAAKLLGLKPKRRQLHIKTGDGLVLTMPVREMIYKTDSDMQFIQPLAPLTNGAVQYHTAFTASAADARQFYETEQGIVPLTSFVDAIYFYGIFQRSHGGKDDASKLALIKSVAPKYNKYAKRRAAEMNIDDRVLNYLQDVIPAQVHTVTAI
jgi:hypothetical protein